MFSNLRHRARSQEGFTLIELLVVILIIGILAAIALPAFLGQQKKGQDSQAKSNARNLATQVESCYQDNQAYTGCTDTALANSSLPFGTGASSGKVHVEPGTPASGYTITAYSKSGANFTITRATNGTVARDCTTSDGGCNASWKTS